jgi:hypothetical protein
MTLREPPEFATWLLRHFVARKNRDALIGDLYEQFALGRTVGWFWWQTGVALAITFLRFLREHGLSLVRAVAAGWCVMVLWYGINSLAIELLPFFIEHHQKVLTRENAQTFWMVLFSIQTVTRLALFTAAGWLLAKLHPAHRHIALAILFATAMAWRFVPWQLLPVFDELTHRVIHNVTAIGGMLIGALVLGRPRAQRRIETT